MALTGLLQQSGQSRRAVGLLQGALSRMPPRAGRLQLALGQCFHTLNQVPLAAASLAAALATQDLQEEVEAGQRPLLLRSLSLPLPGAVGPALADDPQEER